MWEYDLFTVFKLGDIVFFGNELFKFTAIVLSYLAHQIFINTLMLLAINLLSITILMPLRLFLLVGQNYFLVNVTSELE